MSHDVFISYSTKDKTISDAICAKLEERKIRCWIAPRDIPAGQNFARSIIDAIDTCKVFVLIWSANTNTSEHILNEINQAFDQGITIIPFRIQDVQPTKEMRYYFGRTHWLDALTLPLEQHIGTLAETILALLGRTAGAANMVMATNDRPLDEKKLPEETASKATPTTKSRLGNIENDKFVVAPKFEHEAPARLKESMKEGVNRALVLRKKPLNRKVLISIASGLLVIGLLAVLFSSEFFNKNSLFDKTEVVQTSTNSSGLVPLKTPTIQYTMIPSTAAATMTPVNSFKTSTPYPDWVDEFSAKIMTAIATAEPEFQDDFSSMNAKWFFEPCNSNPSAVNIFDGRLIMNAESGCWSWAKLPTIGLHNFAIKIDVNLQRNNSKAKFQIDEALENTAYLFEIYRTSEWVVYSRPAGKFYRIGDGKTPVDLAKNSVTITILFFENQSAIYINNTPIYYHDFHNIDRQNEGHFGLTVQEGTDDKQGNMVEFDNFKVWDLDKIESLSVAPTPE